MNVPVSLPNRYFLWPAGLLGSKAALRDAIITALLSSGWLSVGPITGGTRLIGASPQFYVVQLDIYAHPSANGVILQLNSAVSAAVGPGHFLAYNAAYSWQMLSHPCGLAISPPGQSYVPATLGAAGSSVLLGIPFVPDNCGSVGTPTTEDWFSFGDTDGSIFVNSCPRLNIDIGNRHDLSNLGCYNGSTSPFQDLNAWNGSQILRLSSAALDGSGSDSHPLLYGETDLLYPAFMAWPDVAGGKTLVRGQIYNAAVRSGEAVLDTIATWDGQVWMNYTASYFWGSLWLLKSSGSTSGRSNVVY